MAKNNHSESITEQKLDRLFSNQDFSHMEGNAEDVDRYLNAAALYAVVENGIAVLSDLKLRRSYLFYGFLGDDLGIAEHGTTRILDTIWEEEILSRIKDDDLTRKQADELVFFSYVRKQEKPMDFYMTSYLTMNDSKGCPHCVRHRIFYFGSGKTIRYALCLYNPAPGPQAATISNTRTGSEQSMEHATGNGNVLSPREKEVLSLISRGLSSKDIAKALGISVYTVSRHRQNIIEAMKVRNSTEACKMASLLGILQ